MSNLKRTLIHGLEHGLKVEYKLRDDSGFRLDGMYDEMEGQANVQGSMIDWLHEFDFVKPYLFPLSSLTKEIEIGGSKFIPLEKLFIPEDHDMQIRFIRKDNRVLEFYTHYTGSDEDESHYELYLEEWWSWEFWIIDKLIELHFNIYNLSPDEFIEVAEENNPYRS